MIVVRDYQEGLIKLPIYSAAAIVKGSGAKWGVDASSTSTCAMIPVDDIGTDIFAIINEAKTIAQAATNIQTPVVYQAQCILVDNPKVFKVYYDMSTANDADVTSSTASIITHATSDDNLDGSWVYVNSGTGAGQLRYIKAADTTTKTVNTAFTTTPDSTSDIILIRNIGRATAGYALDTTFSLMKTVLDETASTNMIVLKNFMQGPMGTIELDPTLNSGAEMDGLNARGVRFFAHVMFADTAVHAQGIA